jgi:ribosomal protein S18 acetylase RimI-like enzyme
MIKKINFKKKKFLNFIKKIELPYSETRKLENSPWKYNKLKHFVFMQYEKNNRVIGLIVFSRHRYNYHLNFLYVDKNYRSKGVGKILMNYFLSKKEKKIFTVHVNKKFKRALGFYYSLGFTKFKKHNILLSFVNKCKKFDRNVYKDKYLIIKKK